MTELSDLSDIDEWWIGNGLIKYIEYLDGVEWLRWMNDLSDIDKNIKYLELNWNEWLRWMICPIFLNDELGWTTELISMSDGLEMDR